MPRDNKFHPQKAELFSGQTTLDTLTDAHTETAIKATMSSLYRMLHCQHIFEDPFSHDLSHIWIVALEKQILCPFTKTMLQQ